MKGLGGFPDSLLLGPQSGGAVRLMDKGTLGCGDGGSIPGRRPGLGEACAGGNTTQPREWCEEQPGLPEPLAPCQPSQGFWCLSWSNGQSLKATRGGYTVTRPDFYFEKVIWLQCS